MNLIDIIKNKIKFKNKKVFGMNYKEFCENEKNSSNNENFSDKALDKFSRKNNDYPTKEEFEEHKRQIQQNELESDRFKNVEKFLMSITKGKIES